MSHLRDDAEVAGAGPAVDVVRELRRPQDFVRRSQLRPGTPVRCHRQHLRQEPDVIRVGIAQVDHTGE